MAKVESFDLDHTKVKAPYVRIAGRQEHQRGICITKFDLRLLQPNKEAFSTAAMHTIEHLLATHIRDYLEGVIDISPMGCRTGFYLILWGKTSVEKVRDALVKSLEIITKSDKAPATTIKQCGHFRDHSLFGAKIYAKEILKKGISLDPFERII